MKLPWWVASGWLTLGLAFAARPAGAEVTGANIPLEQAPTVIHVDNRDAKAADTNPGSREAPVKTVARGVALAVASNQQGAGVKVLIHPGTYREGIDLHFTGKETLAPMFIKAAEKGKAIISGSDVWADWQPQAGAPVWTHAWTLNSDAAPYPGGWAPYVMVRPIMRRGEMIFLDGRLLRQVLSPMELTEGSFYVCPRKQMVYVWPPQGIDMKTAVVEVAVRRQVFLALGKRNLAVRGVVFQHAANRCDSPAVQIANCRDVLAEDCVAQWNNWSGLGLAGCDNVTARRLVLNHNGGSGGGGWTIHNILWEDTEQTGNNWRGHWAKFHDWAPAGCKFMLIRARLRFGADSGADRRAQAAALGRAVVRAHHRQAPRDDAARTAHGPGHPGRDVLFGPEKVRQAAGAEELRRPGRALPEVRKQAGQRQACAVGPPGLAVAGTLRRDLPGQELPMHRRAVDDLLLWRRANPRAAGGPIHPRRRAGVRPADQGSLLPRVAARQ